MLRMLLGVKFLDVVDIVVVTFIFYRIFLLFKGTRAIQVLKGLSVLIIASFIAQRTGLDTISWILKSFWTVWIIALIIIFLPELRGALAHLGEYHFSRLFFKEEEKFIEEIIKAAKMLSRKKRGALLVFERKTGLKNYMETGIKIDSKVTSELLNTIFIPRSLLHDGAVIIKGERIAAASCLLPLGQNPHLSKTLGTRHRAALGITEETDALALVISEETGSIALVVSGRITPHLDIQTLKEMLESYLEERS